VSRAKLMMIVQGAEIITVIIHQSVPSKSAKSCETFILPYIIQTLLYISVSLFLLLYISFFIIFICFLNNMLVPLF